ncbi:MAG: hypothetical protein ABFS35_10220 [Bacteroidota bacterium]
MKYSVYTVLILSFFYFSCQKNNPEIAGTNELSAVTYSEKIYTQPISINNQVVSLVNDGTSTLLNGYDLNGSKIWSTNTDGYIIQDLTYDDITKLELQKNNQGEILLNMMHGESQDMVLKSVKFTNYGSYHSEFTDIVRQTDTIFYQTDTISLPKLSQFSANGIVPLSNGSTAVISSWKQWLVDTTLIQMSVYDDPVGSRVSDRYFKLNGNVEINHVYISSHDHLVLEATDTINRTLLYFVDISTGTVFSSSPLPIFDLFSFYENANGEFILIASTLFNLEYRSHVICLNTEGVGLWSKTFVNNASWMFNSVTETSNGYIFTGFMTENSLLNNFDWRTTFDKENVKAMILKTDFQANFENDIGWFSILDVAESSVGAVTLSNANLTLFGGKYDRTVHNTFILKLDNEGKIIQ